MEESWAFVKLCEAGVGVDGSDETTAFSGNLGTQRWTDVRFIGNLEGGF